jgi:hypothetical protein
MSEEVKNDQKEKRTKASPNYALEQYGDISAEGFTVWQQLKDGFVSPGHAFMWANKNKVLGQFRVIRVASEVFTGTLVQAEPVYTLNTIQKKTNKKKSKAKKTKEPLMFPGSVTSNPNLEDETVFPESEDDIPKGFLVRDGDKSLIEV